MDLLRHTLRDARTGVQSAAVDAREQRAFERAPDDELATHLGAVAELARLVEGMLLDAVGEAARRADDPVRAQRMTDRLGGHDLSELLQRTTRLSPQTARRLQRAATAVRPSVSDTTGEVLDASFPSVRTAMIVGVLGIDGILSIVDPLQSTAPRVAPAAERKRHVTRGVATPDGIPLRAMLLPEVAAQRQTIFDAQLSPRVSFPASPGADGGADDGARGPSDLGCGDDGPVAALDDRTRRQKQHDAFAAALGVAASSGRLPTIGGAPATGSSVTADDVRSRCATAAASSPGAASPSHGARSTAWSSAPAADRPTPTTGCCCAGTTIGRSTAAGGAPHAARRPGDAAPGRVRRLAAMACREHGADPPAHPDPAGVSPGRR